MSDYSTEDIVKYSISGDGARVKEAIQSVIASKIMTGMEATAEVNRDQLCKCTQGVPRTPKPSEEVTKGLGSLDVPINS